jgi:hypothetical protein
MIRTIIALLVLCAAILWLPLAVQMALFVVAIILVPYRLAILVPAVFSDALYGPASTLSIGQLKMTILVLVLLLVHWFIRTHTRIRYGRTS